MRQMRWMVTLLILFLVIPAFLSVQGIRAQEGEEEEGFPLMGSMGSMRGHGLMGGGRMHAMPRFFAMMQEELGLTDAQVSALDQVRMEALKEHIRRKAAIQIAELELRELLAADTVDLAQVEAKVREIEQLRAEKRIVEIRLHEKAKGILTPEQRKQLRSLERRMLRMRGRHGEEGMQPGLKRGKRRGHSMQ